ncbi:MAG: hypothetical protein FJ225_13150 [Lentisphaerae bacterium]|nr:hypothetical protein [Lentisphaerota bacterium]
MKRTAAAIGIVAIGCAGAVAQNAAPAGQADTPDAKGKYHFDGKISREVLENYLARNLNMLALSDSDWLDEDTRMILNVGAKFVGRAAITWWAGDVRIDIEAHYRKAGEAARRLHAKDPEIMLEAGVMETVCPGIDAIPIPAWVFEEFGLKPETRNFDHRQMAGRGGHGHGCISPDIGKQEFRMWVYYCSRRYIDLGYEVIHVGMIGLMGNDPGLVNWFDVLGRLRRYANQNARRHLVLFNSQHTPGFVANGKLLLDMHQMQLRPVDVVESPQKCVLQMGYGDTIFGRSAGGITPSGWNCDHLPYYIQFDNGYATGKEGQHIGFPYAWGYIEIDWFAHQSEAYRNEWLRYAWDWLRKNDTNGWLQMPGRIILSVPLKDAKGGKLHWYTANTCSAAAPDGFNQEETIKAIWSGTPASTAGH